MFNEKENRRETKILHDLQEISDLGVEAMQLSAHAKEAGEGVYPQKSGRFEAVVVLKQKDELVSKMYLTQETSVTVKRTFDNLITTISDELKQLPPWKRRIERFLEDFLPIYNGSETRLTTLINMLTQYSDAFVKGGIVDFHIFAPIRAISMVSDLLKLDKKKLRMLIPDLIITD